LSDEWSRRVHLAWAVAACAAAIVCMIGLLSPVSALQQLWRGLLWLATPVQMVATLEALRQSVGMAAVHFAPVTLALAAAVGLFSVRAALRHFALHTAWGRAIRINAPKGPQIDWKQGLLPSQINYVQDFLRELQMREHDLYSAKILAVRGVWGSGKTTVVQAMRRALDQPQDKWGVGTPSATVHSREFVPAFMNAWRDENPDDLHGRLVERVMLVPRVLRATGWRASGISTRFLWSLTKRNIRERRPTRIARFKASLSQKLSDAEATAEVEVQGPPTPLTYQEDLENIVCALRRNGQQLVLFVDELDRGTPSSVQAMLVMLRRSLDLQGVHLVVPFVLEVLSELAFNPLRQESQELAAASYAALAASDAIGRPDQQALRGVSLSGYRAAAGIDGARAAKPKDGMVDGESMRLRRVSAMQDGLLKAFLSLDRLERTVLQRKMSEKYIGFERALPRVTAEDLCAFVWSMSWLRSEGRLGTLLSQTLTGSLNVEPEAARRAAMSFLNNESANPPVWKKMGAKLRFLLIDDGAAQWPVLQPGAFSWRSFESYVHLLLAQPVSVKEWPNFGVDESDANASFEAMTFAMAHLILAALVLFSYEQGLPPRS